MRVGMLWALVLAGCGQIQAVCLDDYDGDGVCGSEDTCPLDVLNDEDGDGICGSVDVCPNGNDADDEDRDGIADACDTCLKDTLNDVDGDGICGMVDLCPQDPDNDCLRSYTIGIAVDAWFDESSWQLRQGGQLVDEGLFDARGDGIFGTWEFASDGGRVCIETTDSYGDGGVRAEVWDDELGLMATSFGYRDWETDGAFCFDIGAGKPTGAERPFNEEDYLTGLQECTAYLKMITASWGRESGFTFLDRRGGQLLHVPTGTLTDRRTYEYEVAVWDDDFTVRMLDTLGDTWHGGVLEIRVGDRAGEVLYTLAIASGARSEDAPITIDCP